MKSFLYRVLVPAVILLALPVLAGCTDDSGYTQQQMDDRREWAEAVLPFMAAEGFEGAASGTLAAADENAGNRVGLGSVPPGDYLVYFACSGDDPVDLRVTSTGGPDLASTTLDCDGSTSVEVTTTTEGLVVDAEGEGPADWAVAVVRSAVH